MKNACDTFLNFLAMFDMANLPLEARQMIYSSATVVLTVSTKAVEKYLRKIEKLIKDLEKVKTNLPNQEYLI